MLIRAMIGYITHVPPQSLSLLDNHWAWELKSSAALGACMSLKCMHPEALENSLT